MRQIIKITKAELQTLFYSPIAWLIIVVFFFQSGTIFFNVLENLIRFQTHAQSNGNSLHSLTSQLLTSNGRLFSSVLTSIHLYIPLLTMNIMCREYASGSIKLLYSSPVSNWQIIIGKYLSLVVYALIMVAMLLIYVLIAYYNIEILDLPVALTGLLGIFLLICTYAAIGLFMSSLTSYQIVAAIFTFIILTGLSMLKYIGQNVDFLRDITYWMSIKGRVYLFIKGLITSEDVLYFILVPLLFISFTVIRLESKRKKVLWKITFSKYLISLFFISFLGYITSRPIFKMYYDASYTKSNSILKQSEEILNKIDGKLKITTYVNLLSARSVICLPTSTLNDKSRYDKYTRFKHDIDFEYKFFYRGEGKLADKPDSVLIPKLKKNGERYCVNVSNTPKYNEVEGIDVIENEWQNVVKVIEDEKGNKAFLRTYNGKIIHPSEKQISIALKSLLYDMPTIGYVTGHKEKDIYTNNDLSISNVFANKFSISSLLNNGFSFQNISLTEEIKNDIDILFIANPKIKYTDAELQNIEKYIEKGGNLFITTDVFKQPVINPILSKLNVKLLDGVIVNKQKGVDPMEVWSCSTKNTFIDRLILLNYSCSVLEYQDSEFKITPLTTTKPKIKYWNELETTNFNKEDVSMNKNIGEKIQTFPTSIALERNVNNKKQKIIVVGDTDFLINKNSKKSHSDKYIHNCFYWLSNGIAPLKISRTEGQDKYITMSKFLFKIYNIFIHYILNVFFILFALWLLYRRMSK